MKVSAGLGKLFRPAAPSTVRKHGSSKVRPLKGDGGSNKAGYGGEESMSDASSSVIAVKGAEYQSASGETSGSVSAAKPNTAADKQTDTSRSSDPDVTVHRIDRNTTEWSQLPGAIPDNDKAKISKDRTPPISMKKAPPPTSRLNGNPINPDDIENVPQAGKKYVRDVRARRVMKEYRAVKKACHHPDSTFNVELIEDNIYDWDIKLYEVDPMSLLHYDMEKYDIPFVSFNMTFPDNFPFSPPFVRVVSPRIENGYVMDGGAICMELLTPGGWSSAYTIEAIVMQLGATLVAGHARVATGKRYRLFGDVPFNKQEAIDSFRNVVETHKRYGWATPAGDFS